MIENIGQLKTAVESQFGGCAEFIEAVHVEESFKDRPVWDGVVSIFGLTDHPTATRAYAWSSPIDGSKKRRYFAVLHQPPITSPIDAVRAAIVQESKMKEKQP